MLVSGVSSTAATNAAAVHTGAAGIVAAGWSAIVVANLPVVWGNADKVLVALSL